MKYEQRKPDSSTPSAAEIMNYINGLEGAINTGPLDGDGWFVSGSSNEHGMNNPSVSLSRKDPANPHVGLITKTVPFEEFKSWQK